MKTNPSERTQSEVLNYIQQHGLIHPGDNVCVCYSGGIDSAVLLDILYALKDRIPFRLCACHMHHGIRGEEADRDALFCEKQAKDRYQIPFFSTRKDIPELSKQRGLSLEEAGRNARYEWFDQLAEQFQIDLFATAHQKNDLAETVLYRMIRGTTVAGMSGIPVKRGRIIRPILFLSRSEILQYAERHQVSFREDSTNDDTDYTRNRIRHTILPEMERMNPNIVDSLSRLAASCEEATGLIRQLVPASDRETDYRSWNIAALKVRLSEAYAALSGSSLCHYHIDAICDAVYSGKNCKISLPKNWTAVCRDGKVGFEQPAGKAGEISPEVFEGTLVFGANDVNSFCTVILSETEIDAASAKRFVNNLSTEIFLRKDGIHGTLRYRTREPGDHITEFGVSKKLKKVLNERKIPLSVRPYIPVIYDDSGICCVPFVATADRVFSKHSADSFLLYVSIDATDPLKEGDFR